MPWSDAYATGIARLDEQHQRLFQMVEDFQAALDEGWGERVYGGLLHLLDPTLARGRDPRGWCRRRMRGRPQRSDASCNQGHQLLCGFTTKRPGCF
jgi:hypothetical protein